MLKQLTLVAALLSASASGVSLSTSQLKRGPGPKPISAVDKLTEGDVAHIKETFDLLDRDNSGELSSREFYIALKMLDLSPTKETKRLVRAVDKDRNGSLDYAEFEGLMADLMQREVQQEESPETLDLTNLRKYARELAETLSDEEIQEMID